MAMTPQALPEQDYSRAPSILIGKQDFFSTELRLIAMELYKLRRRTMTKVLIGVGLLAIIVTYVVVAFYTSTQASRPASDFTPQQCPQVRNTNKPCLDHQPTQAEMDQYKQHRIASLSSIMRLPGSLETSVILGANILFVLVLILTGTNVGGEYGLGTVRLMFTRGPTRLQFLLAKIVAVLAFIIPMVLAMTLLSIVLGLVLNPLTGITPDYSFFNLTWLGHAILYILVIVLAWFVYSMAALFCGTLGRATAVGIVGAFAWVFTESILNAIILEGLGDASGPVPDFLRSIPTYFMSINVEALIHNQAHYVLDSASDPITDLHALTVLAVYIIAFIALSCWLTVRRDVTN